MLRGKSVSAHRAYMHAEAAQPPCTEACMKA